MRKKKPLTVQAEKLKQLVTEAGGPAAFAKKYSRDKEKPIDPTFVSQILNGYSSFRDEARKNMAERAGLPKDYFEAVEAREPSPPAYIDTGQATKFAEDIDEVINIMLEVGGDCRRDILGAARLALTQHRINQQNSRKRAGQ